MYRGVIETNLTHDVRERLIPKFCILSGARTANSPLRTCACMCARVCVCGPEDEDGFDCVLL